MNALEMGVGLRPKHYERFLDGEVPPGITWVEALTENYLPLKFRRGPHSSSDTRASGFLEKIREKLPVVLHGVSMNVGSTDPLSTDYLAALKTLIDLIDPPWFSDHLCWTGVDGVQLHDLYPLPYTEEAITHIVGRIGKIQDTIGRRFLIENVSSYLEIANSEMTEATFIAEIARRSGCGILLDINNVYVSGMNHGFNPRAYLEAIPFESVGQIHLAGHVKKNGLLIDTHSEPVTEEVWKLYRWYCERYGLRPTMIERDANIPEWDVLAAEVNRGKEIRDAIAPTRA